MASPTLERQVMERELVRPVAKELKRQRKIVNAEAAKDFPDFELVWENFREGMTVALIPPLIDIYDQSAARTTGVVLASKQNLLGDLLTNARGWATGYAAGIALSTTNTTRRIVSTVLATVATTPGMTISDFKDMTANAFGPERAKSIAITEATRAQFEGTRDTQSELHKLGFTTQLVWFTVNDDRVCPICAPLHGVPEDNPGGGVWDGGITQPAHTGCRCRTGAEAI
jgi:hypothetical protein